jgi:hypothetical protein
MHIVLKYKRYKDCPVCFTCTLNSVWGLKYGIWWAGIMTVLFSRILRPVV